MDWFWDYFAKIVILIVNEYFLCEMPERALSNAVKYFGKEGLFSFIIGVINYIFSFWLQGIHKQHIFFFIYGRLLFHIFCKECGFFNVFYRNWEYLWSIKKKWNLDFDCNFLKIGIYRIITIFVYLWININFFYYYSALKDFA